MLVEKKSQRLEDDVFRFFYEDHKVMLSSFAPRCIALVPPRT